MDKNAIKKYAVWARRELIERVSQRAMIYGITAKDAGDPNAESVNGHLLLQAEKRQRQALIRNIKTKGYEQVMEEVADTWFNRFAALRFMEVNGYLPSHIRVFTNDAGDFKPQILAEAIHLELEGLDMNKVYELESANKSEELFKYLLIVQCNALNSILPGMFQRIEDYTELLLPDYLLREGSVIEQMVTTIPEEDWTDQVQIIGWLYQYYNTEPKDKVFADLKKNIKITKENIPAATQLFTPDWIVHYMVENSLGRLWLEGHPNDALKSEWKYYLDEAEQEPEVQAQLAAIRKEYAALKPEEIRAIDPCMGSGHILCVLFDVLVRIYEDYGYTAREAAVKIVENNLWGLDIEERAAQLSYFSVMMKARQYDRRFFSRSVQPHIYAFEESNGITSAPLHDMGIGMSQEEYGNAVKQIMRMIEEFHDAKEYGSILRISKADWDLLRKFAVPRWEAEGGQIPLNIHGEVEAAPRLQAIINLGQAMSQQYHVVVTNPPYMGISNADGKLNNYVKNEYPNSKSDLFAVFIERCNEMAKKNCYQAMITQHSWMFISTFEKLREQLQSVDTVNMIHLGARAFEEIAGEVVQTTSFVFRRTRIPFYKGCYCRLVDGSSQDDKEKMFLTRKHLYFANKENFEIVDGKPIAYWVPTSSFAAFGATTLKDVTTASVGIQTGDNNKFLHLWWEIDPANILFTANSVSDSFQDRKWFPYNKGGEFRKWYGNDSTVINWRNDGEEIKNNSVITGHHYQQYADSLKFRPLVTWSRISTGTPAFRLKTSGFLSDMAGFSLYADDNKLKGLIAYCNSAVARYYLDFLAPTLNIMVGSVLALPYKPEITSRDDINALVDEIMAISKDDWDSFECSWGFKRHPLLRGKSTIREAYKEWEDECNSRYLKLKTAEEKINQILIDIYGLNGELTPDVMDEDVSIRKANVQREIKSLISYSVGCMFGRYSLDNDGLIYAGGAWDASKYICYMPDKDAIIPICDDEYFEDDILGRFVEFIKAAYGEETCEENLRFIAEVLGGKGSPKNSIRNYFLNEFYSDHCGIYSVASSGKRPIYWLFDSGKKNGFKCLIYMHRYQPDTIARIRTDYVHEQQSRYRTAIADLEQRINGASTSERVKLSKQLATLQAQAEEIRVYEEKIHHLADQMIKIDLDDGVKHNYEIFKDVLAKIK